MREDTKQRRHEAISDAAYDLLGKRGYDGASMLSIAKVAKASNETLYKWYGDKKGLFEALVRDNAARTETLLTRALEEAGDPMESLRQVAPVFLTMLLGDRAILLNKAAASEHTGELGAVISAGGREVVQPMFTDLIARVTNTTGTEAQTYTRHFLALLVADFQIKRVIGVQGTLTQAQIEAQVASALSAFEMLLAEG